MLCYTFTSGNLLGTEILNILKLWSFCSMIAWFGHSKVRLKVLIISCTGSLLLFWDKSSQAWHSQDAWLCHWSDGCDDNEIIITLWDSDPLQGYNNNHSVNWCKCDTWHLIQQWYWWSCDLVWVAIWSNQRSESCFSLFLWNFTCMKQFPWLFHLYWYSAC